MMIFRKNIVAQEINIANRNNKYKCVYMCVNNVPEKKPDEGRADK